MQEISGDQKVPQFFVDRRKPIVGTAQQPVGHGLPGKHNLLSRKAKLLQKPFLEDLLLPVVISLWIDTVLRAPARNR